MVDVMHRPQPVLTVQLFPSLLGGLLEVLSALSAAEWAAQVPRKSWSVRDVALHLLGGDVGILSRGRDGFTASNVNARTKEELVRGLKALNDSWIDAGQRISPPLLCDLLRFTGDQATRYFESLDPSAPGERVSWAGPQPAPNWLGIGREYTERWHHQQHIREAIGRPGFDDARYLKPALRLFMRALPEAYRGVEAPDGTAVAVTIAGESGDRWLLLREAQTWNLYTDTVERPDAAVVIPQQEAWKLFTRWLPKDEAFRGSEIRGDAALARRVFDTTAVIA
jgi:uncharacterized protein (TIGR03083 family)